MIFCSLKEPELKCRAISAIVTPYETDVPKKYVVHGNDVLLSCELPSHVADLLRVTAWLDSEGHELGQGNLGKHRCIQ